MSGESRSEEHRRQASARADLGLDEDATKEDVRQAFRQLAKEVHPDAPGGSRDKYEEVRRSYERALEEVEGGNKEVETPLMKARKEAARRVRMQKGMAAEQSPDEAERILRQAQRARAMSRRRRAAGALLASSLLVAGACRFATS